VSCLSAPIVIFENVSMRMSISFKGECSTLPECIEFDCDFLLQDLLSLWTCMPNS
jgi:hypothetical protein